MNIALLSYIYIYIYVEGRGEGRGGNQSEETHDFQKLPLFPVCP